MVYTGDKPDRYCMTCRRKRTWVKCRNCNGRGPTWTTTCNYKCTEGYKCETAPENPHHPVGEVK
jgi:hypothetical protein